MSEVYMVKNAKTPIEIFNELEIAKIEVKKYSQGYILKYPNLKEAQIAIDNHNHIGSYSTPNPYSLLKEVYD